MDKPIIENLARPLVSIIGEFYKDPENEKKYQQWRESNGKSNNKLQELQDHR